MNPATEWTMPPQDAICAIVVTFHPDELTHENLAALGAQVRNVVVVDNGSSVEEVAKLRLTAMTLGLELIENGANLGIATALNIGIRHAMEAGREWIFLFDQDSTITAEFVPRMLQAYAQNPWGERLRILMPRYVDRRLNKPLPAIAAEEGLAFATTSGSLTHRDTFAELGLFADELFIDQVDYDFSLRTRERGYVIGEAADVVLLHSPGEPIAFRVFGRTWFHVSSYSPVRHYYQERNKIWMWKRHGRSFPALCMKFTAQSARGLLQMLLAENDRFTKCRFMVRGVLDGLRGRMGQLVQR